MTVTLGGITLDNDPLPRGFKAGKALNASVEISIAGNEIEITNAHGGHYSVELESTRDSGWLKGSTIDSLFALAQVAGATYTLSLNGTEYEVRFRNEVESCIDMEQFQPTSNPDDDTYYIGKIYLMVV